MLSSWIFVQISRKKGKILDPVIPNFPLEEENNNQLIIDLANKFLSEYPSIKRRSYKKFRENI